MRIAPLLGVLTLLLAVSLAVPITPSGLNKKTVRTHGNAGSRRQLFPTQNGWSLGHGGVPSTLSGFRSSSLFGQSQTVTFNGPTKPPVFFTGIQNQRPLVVVHPPTQNHRVHLGPILPVFLAGLPFLSFFKPVNLPQQNYGVVGKPTLHELLAGKPLFSPSRPGKAPSPGFQQNFHKPITTGLDVSMKPNTQNDDEQSPPEELPSIIDNEGTDASSTVEAPTSSSTEKDDNDTTTTEPVTTSSNDSITKKPFYNKHCGKCPPKKQCLCPGVHY